MNEYPLVTCLQLSYGRPRLSVEAVECFLRQSYPNKKLIIVNTHPSPVYFKQEQSNIEVHNIQPLSHLSDVYRFGMDLINSEYFCVWDDDDLFLPWHIQDRVDFSIQNPQYDAIGHIYCISSCDNKMTELARNMFVAQYLYRNNGIRPDKEIACWDVNWHDKPWRRGFLNFPQKPSYVYRWGTGESHISGLAGEEGQHQGYLNNISEKRKLTFDFPWEPSWRRDYVQDFEKLLTNDKETSNRIHS